MKSMEIFELKDFIIFEARRLTYQIPSIYRGFKNTKQKQGLLNDLLNMTII